MRDYAVVSPRYYTGATGKIIRAAGISAQALGQYLMTCPNSNMLGMYYLPIPTITHELALNRQGALKGLRSLFEGGFADYDPPSEYVWVFEMARWQVLGASLKPLNPRDNRVEGIMNELNRLPDLRFKAPFIERYRVDFCFPDSFQASPFEAPCKPLRSQEQEQEQETGAGDLTAGRSRDRKSTGYSPDFLAFWNAYPTRRRTKKPLAWKAWQKECPPLDAVLAALRWQVASDDWTRDGGEYIPGPVPYLNARRWEDEPAAPAAPTPREAPITPIDRAASLRRRAAKLGGDAGASLLREAETLEVKSV